MPSGRNAERGFTVRPAKQEDSPELVAQRRAMFEAMGHRDTAALDGMCASFLPWVKSKMDDGEYFAWFAIAQGGSIAAGLGLWLMDWPPHMIGPGARRANILNVYTYPDYRRHGLARRLMEVALDHCHGRGIRAVILHASKDGRPLYESLGFRPTNEMRIVLGE